MNTSLSSMLDIKHSWTFSNVLENSTTKDSTFVRYKRPFSNGTGNNQANEHFHDVRDVNPGADDDLDLSGVLVNAFGRVCQFTKIKKLLLINMGVLIDGEPEETDGFDLEIGGAPSGAASLFTNASAGLVVSSGGVFVVTNPLAGYEVTQSSADILRISNPAASGIVRYRIFIEGLGVQ